MLSCVRKRYRCKNRSSVKSESECQDNEEVQVERREVWTVQVNVKITAISPLYKLIWPLHVRIRGD